MVTHPATTPVYAVLKAISDPTVRRIWPHEVIGAENMPNGPAIIASNHLAFCDSVFIPLAVKPTVNFLAKSDYFTTPGFKGRAMAAFFRSVGQLPMDRSGGEKSRASLEAGLKVLRAGECSASTLKEPAVLTDATTALKLGWRVLRWNLVHPWYLWVSWAPT